MNRRIEQLAGLEAFGRVEEALVLEEIGAFDQ